MMLGLGLGLQYPSMILSTVPADALIDEANNEPLEDEANGDILTDEAL